MNAPALKAKPEPVATLTDPQSIKLAPASAFQFAASPFQFAAAGEADAGASAPFTMIARTGAPVEHWFWGRIVHDFSGMEHRDRVPVDYVHITWEPIGYADKFDASSGDLVIAGSIESIDPKDEAAKLIARSRRGIPYQASIHFDPNAIVLEFLPENFTAEVNGQTVEGPLVIARKWTLRGVAICPHGHDVGSECEIDAAAAFSLTWKGSAMSKDSTTNAPADAGQLTATTAPVTTPATTPATPGVDPAGDARAQFVAEAREQLKRFQTKFGEQGAEYFAAGLDFPAACERHIDKLSADLKTERDARTEAETKLSAAQLSHGEKGPVDTAGASATAKPFATLFRRAG